MMKFEIKHSQFQRLQQLVSPDRFNKGIDIALKRIGLEMQKDAIGNAPYQTGNLRRSLTIEQDKTSVAVGTDLVYAPIHEFGGTIRPKSAKFLRFQIGGQWVMAKSVTIKKRPYLKPAFEKQKMGRAIDIFTDEIDRIFTKQ